MSSSDVIKHHHS